MIHNKGIETEPSPLQYCRSRIRMSICGSGSEGSGSVPDSPMAIEFQKWHYTRSSLTF
jgi:hypothetical protein